MRLYLYQRNEVKMITSLKNTVRWRNQAAAPSSLGGEDTGINFE